MLAASVVGLTGAAATPSDPNADGITNLAKCYANTRTAAVNLLIDQSGSLRETDPAAKRVELAKAINQAFATIALLETERKGRIDLAVSGFGSNYERVLDWGPLDRARAEANSAGVSSFAGRNSNRDTDYVLALSGARADLVEHAAAMRPNDPASVCKVVVWFTDGRFSIDSSSPRRPWAQQLPVSTPAERSRVVAEGERVICSAGGEADAMRQADIYLVTLALTSASFGPDEEGLLKRITDGSAEPDCGAVPAGAYGKYFNAGGVEELLIAIIRELTANPPPPGEPGTCDATRCLWTGKVEPLAVGMSLLIKANGAGNVSLLPPGSEPVELTAGGGSARTAAGDEVTWSSALGLRQVAVALRSSQTSAWRVELAPAGPGTALTVYQGFRIAVRLDAATEARWKRGETASVELRLVGPQGEAIAPGRIRSVDLTAALTYGDTKQQLAVTPTGSAGTEFTTSFEPSIDNPAASATVAISGTATTSSGTRVPVAATVSQAVSPGTGPTISGLFDLGVLKTGRAEQRNPDKTQDPEPIRTTRDITIEARGSAGTVCLVDGSEILNGTNEYTITTEGENCVRLEAGDTARNPVLVRIAEPVAGAVTGFVAFTTQSDEPGSEPVLVEVPVKGQVVIDPPDPYTDGRIAWALIALGLLIPALLWAASVIWLAGYRRSAVTALTATTVPVTINMGLADFTLPKPSDDSIRYVDRLSRTRIGFDGVTVRAPYRFFRPQDAIASRPGYTVHGSGGAARGGTGRIAHQLQSQWLVSIPNGTAVGKGQPITGELHLLITIDAIDAERQPNGLADRAQRELGNAYEAIRARLATPAGPDDPLAEPVFSGQSPGNDSDF